MAARSRSTGRSADRTISGRLLLAYFGITFAWGWAAWVPAAFIFRDAGSGALASLPVGLLALQTLGAVSPSASAYLVLRISGRRRLIRWIGDRYRIWQVHPGWYLVAALLVPAIAMLSLGMRALADPDFHIAPQSPLGQMVGEIGIVGVVLVFPLMTLGLMASSPLLEEFGWRGFALPALQARWNALTSSIVLGLAWGAWQLPLFVAYGDPVVLSLLLIVPQTVVMTWVVNSARGSMLLAMLFHASLAVALTAFYAGSHSPVEIVLTWLVAGAVVLRYRPRDLAKAARVSLPPEASLAPGSPR